MVVMMVVEVVEVVEVVVVLVVTEEAQELLKYHLRSTEPFLGIIFILTMTL